MTKYAEDDIEINLIVMAMGNLCKIVFSLDADVAFEMWTKYLRYICIFFQKISTINYKYVIYYLTCIF